MIRASLEQLIRELISGGKYSADLINIYVDSECVWSAYYDEDSNADFCEETYQELCKFCDMYPQQIIEISGFRALQGSKPMKKLF